MIADPAAARVEADLAAAEVLSGVAAGEWRIVAFAFPHLDFVVAATEPDGTASEYGFRAELTNYPAQAPLVRIWDHGAGGPLAGDKRPKGDHRTSITFQVWGDDTVYRPWERCSGPHDSNAAANTHLAWRPDRRLAFIFRDLHGVLNSNARPHRLRASA